MKKILFLVVALLSIVSAKLYSSNQELVFQEPPVVLTNSVLPGNGECEYVKGNSDCTPGSTNGCGAIYDGKKCNSDPPS